MLGLVCLLTYCLLTYNANSLRYTVDTTGTRKERCCLFSPTSVSRGLCVKHTFERRENPETIFSFLLFVPARSATGSDALVLLVSGISTELKPTRTTPSPLADKALEFKVLSQGDSTSQVQNGVPYSHTSSCNAYVACEPVWPSGKALG